MQNFARRARQTLIGDKAFYKAVLAIIIPVIIQNGISNFVNLLDNLMVGALGNEEMSGVAIANQLVFVFNLCVFGGLSGAGIFGAQFYGAGDIEGLRNTFRIKLMQSAALLAVTFIVLLGFSRPLISLFLRGDGDAAMAEKMLGFGHEYLMVILIGLPAFAVSTSYAGHAARDGRNPPADDRQRIGGSHQRGVQLSADLRSPGFPAHGRGGCGRGHGA